jgi:hypothetical protein
MEHAATSISKNRVSRLAVMIADFCNKLCQYPTFHSAFGKTFG